MNPNLLERDYYLDCGMIYDVQIGQTCCRELTYAELVMFPLDENSLVRRDNSDWMRAVDCVELSHILAQHYASPVYQTEEELIENAGLNENYISNDGYPDSEDYYPPTPQPFLQSSPGYEVVEEPRVFIPTAEYFKCKQKRKAAIIGVCTLGLAGLSLMGVGNTWRSNIFAGTSFSANAGMGFVLKCLSFCLLTMLIAIPYFVYSIIALIYYSIRIRNLKR
ncbi:MAG: hypothetical protein K2K97_09180 [Muribaculaceae bacterium]|nr:hypothetical protein [Muribaculaceae bacterium]